MQPKTLRVRASGKALVQNHEKLEAGTNSFIGRRFEAGTGFVPTDETEEVPWRPEYILALKAGDLEAADKATADAAGLKTEETKEERKPGGNAPPATPTTSSSSGGGK